MNSSPRTILSSFLIMSILIMGILTASCTRSPEQVADVIYSGGDIITINDAHCT